MVQFLSINIFLGFLQFLLGFSKVPVFFVSPYIYSISYVVNLLAKRLVDMTYELTRVLHGSSTEILHNSLFDLDPFCTKVTVNDEL